MGSLVLQNSLFVLEHISLNAKVCSEELQDVIGNSYSLLTIHNIILARRNITPEDPLLKVAILP